MIVVLTTLHSTVLKSTGRQWGNDKTEPRMTVEQLRNRRKAAEIFRLMKSRVHYSLSSKTTDWKDSRQAWCSLWSQSSSNVKSTTNIVEFSQSASWDRHVRQQWACSGHTVANFGIMCLNITHTTIYKAKKSTPLQLVGVYL